MVRLVGDIEGDRFHGGVAVALGGYALIAGSAKDKRLGRRGPDRPGQ